MSGFGRKRKTTKKLYAVKRSKTGRKSVVQVVSRPGKGRVYASTGRKLAKGTKSFTTKTAAGKHLKSLQVSSFGRKRRKRKSVKRKSVKAKKGQGWIACVNPDADPERPSTNYKVFKAYTYRVNGESVRLFYTGTSDMERKYWQITEDSDVKFRRDKRLAQADRIKYGRLKDAGLLDLTPQGCNDEWAAQVIDGSGRSGGVGGGRRMRVSGLMGELLGTDKRGTIRLGTGSSSTQARLGTRGGRNRVSEVFGLDPNVLGYSPELARKLRAAGMKGGFKGASQSMLGNYSARTPLYSGNVKAGHPNPQPRAHMSLDSFKGKGQKFSPSVEKVLGFGRSRFGNIPTYGRYAYPVDPALSRSGGFGRSSYGARPLRRPAFGRINYGFSKYF